MKLNEAQQAFYDFIFPYLNHRQQHGCGGCAEQTLQYNFVFIFVDPIGLLGCKACEDERPPVGEVMEMRAAALKNADQWSPEFAGLVTGVSMRYFGSIQNAFDEGMKMGESMK